MKLNSTRGAIMKEKSPSHTELEASLSGGQGVHRARMYLQHHYGHGVFGNVYLSAGQH